MSGKRRDSLQDNLKESIRAEASKQQLFTGEAFGYNGNKKKPKPREFVPKYAQSISEVLEYMRRNERSIKCTGANLGPNDMKLVADEIKKNTQCCEFFFGANEIKDEGLKHIVEAMRIKAGQLRKLDVGANIIGHAGAKVLAECLKNPASLVRVLSLDHNELGSDGASYMGEVLKIQSQWEALKKSHMSLALGDLSLSQSHVHLERPADGDPLEDLNLAANEISFGPGIQNLMVAVGESPYLTRLNLAGNTLGPDSGVYIAKALAVNSRIAHLDLSGTVQLPNIEGGGVRQLAGSLRMPNAIRQLDSLSCGEGHDNFSLVYLNLAYNCIDDAVGKYLADEIKQNTSIKHLILRGNFIGPLGGRSFAQMLMTSRSMKKLDMSKNSLNPTAGMDFASMLSINKGLRHLNLSENRIGSLYLADDAAKSGPGIAFAEALPQCKTLEHLDLGGCGFSDEEMELIRDPGHVESHVPYDGRQTEGYNIEPQPVLKSMVNVNLD